MIDLKTAVKSARDYLADIYAGEDLSSLTLEEVEANEKEKVWNITFSFYVKDKKPGTPNYASASLTMMGIGDYRRTYKLFTINGEDGRCMSMKIRQLNDK